MGAADDGLKTEHTTIYRSPDNDDRRIYDPSSAPPHPGCFWPPRPARQLTEDLTGRRVHLLADAAYAGKVLAGLPKTSRGPPPAQGRRPARAPSPDPPPASAAGPPRKGKRLRVADLAT